MKITDSRWLLVVAGALALAFAAMFAAPALSATAPQSGLGGDAVGSRPGRAIVTGVGDARVLVGSYVEVDDQPITGLIAPRSTGDTTQIVSTTWASGGKTITVITPRKAGEGVENWARRHREAVQGMELVFSVDPPSGG
jgi:hypothetical protein